MIAWRTPWLLAVSVIMLFGGCTDKGDQPLDNLQPGGVPATYNYKAYNSKGDLAVKGTMTLTVIDTTSLTGSWSLAAVLPSEQVGPQVGTGDLTGTIQKTSLSINLNPGWADNNVFLQGTVSSDRITGRWMWSTFVGPTAEGAFEAVRTLSTTVSNY